MRAVFLKRKEIKFRRDYTEFLRRDLNDTG